MNFDLALKLHFDELTDMERDIANYLYQNAVVIENFGIVALAKKTLSSKSTILRLSKKLGFSGFVEMKKSLLMKKTASIPLQNTLKKWQSDMELFSAYLQDVDFDPIVNAMRSANRIYIYPTGSTQQAYAQIFYQYMLLNKQPVFILYGQSSLDNAVSMITAADVLLVVDYEGETEHDKDPLRLIALKKTTIISITALGTNFVKEQAKYSLFYEAPRINNYDVSLVQLGIILDYLVRLLNN
ncbi:transcriptional regulator [Liquorilactobacillus sucicola DSM 21376 = JCM 15457]|uniref:HTH rpiR-type domain-containing protein n=1 Tax=Liquorilactobacillus sucicola DSM 21376 = JCM 15457 TaxID=1423806 RepID=A0A023CY39_9LACO|nr:MurR/RpiR family transcriptional regulator [Liquorilactobacillus sucicola]KRN07025.1 hypothetical protein FD15_GL000590 [Liquorilactobacillus sucicola DSM 21376 = JCM 15457]GAJ26516.1 transcriptional regulator [Liquorilactobacillus sucicola DSM 21376 = JCM 15457]